MKSKKKALVDELLRSLAPHLNGFAQGEKKPSKAITKTIHQLASQLVRAREKQEKEAAQSIGGTRKAAKQLLTAELVAVLDAHLSEEEYLEEKASHFIAETAEHLADKLTKLRRKTEAKASQPAAAPKPAKKVTASKTAASANRTPGAPAKAKATAPSAKRPARRPQSKTDAAKPDASLPL